MSTDDAFYRWGKLEPITADNLTKRPMDLHLRLKVLEALKVSFEAVLSDVEDKVLAQTETVLAGLRAQLAEVVELNWLTATSTTSITLVAGTQRALIIPSDQRLLFAPGPFAVLQRNADPGTYAIVQTVDYDRSATGQFDFNVLTVQGGPGPFADWSIAAVAGSTLAQMTLLAQGLAAKAATDADAAQTAADRVATDADAASTAADRAAILAAIVAGPVLQVAGLTGVISAAALRAALALTVADVSGAASTAYVDGRITALIGGAPGALDTLKELADALADDANFATTITNALALKADRSSLLTRGQIVALSLGSPL